MKSSNKSLDFCGYVDLMHLNHNGVGSLTSFPYILFVHSY